MNLIYINLLISLFLVASPATNVLTEGCSQDIAQQFIYDLSDDKTMLTFYDLKWDQIYKVQGLSDLPGDISDQGVLWYQEGFLSIRESADSYLSFSIDDRSVPDGTSYRVQSIARYYGPEINGYSSALRSGDMQLSEVSISISCNCIDIQEKNEEVECEAGGSGSVGCGITGIGNSCEVKCREGFESCCND